MPTRVRIQFNSAGFRSILNAPKTWELIDQQAKRIRARAGEGFDVEGPKEMGFGGGRPGAYVVAVTNQAKASEARHKTLSRAVGGG
ncbi:hypothetical protein [Bifidobacterium vansinderenii]|uniref:Uncharacterized protein n=1 Tax=Bifidobacterium vansinderenii TaxID=1984871 RepID=A0A229VWU0_9BIFI|nr:hypothetical protein [Bifidobacterium vansinderenii]OXM99879.1 hypothetical protein Tam10B_1842 [Bifidobacterium vansinderenii]